MAIGHLGRSSGELTSHRVAADRIRRGGRLDRRWSGGGDRSAGVCGHGGQHHYSHFRRCRGSHGHAGHVDRCGDLSYAAKPVSDNDRHSQQPGVRHLRRRVVHGTGPLRLLGRRQHLCARVALHSEQRGQHGRDHGLLRGLRQRHHQAAERLFEPACLSRSCGFSGRQLQLRAGCHCQLRLQPAGHGPDYAIVQSRRHQGNRGLWCLGVLQLDRDVGTVPDDGRQPRQHHARRLAHPGHHAVEHPRHEPDGHGRSVVHRARDLHDPVLRRRHEPPEPGSWGGARPQSRRSDPGVRARGRGLPILHQRHRDDLRLLLDHVAEHAGVQGPQ